MKIEALKDLRAVLKLCHEQGVHEITIDGISMKIGEPPTADVNHADKPNQTPEYSDEDLLMWSTAQHGQDY